jgi:hypothetical protein
MRLRMSDRARIALWLLGAWVILLPALLRLVKTPRLLAEPLPATPVDRTNAHYARVWLFLLETRPFVPPGATYTTIGPTRDDDMLLFELSMGLLADRTALPTTYWGVRQPREGDRAKYVLSLGCVAPPGEVPRLRARLSEGCVYERMGKRR